MIEWGKRMMSRWGKQMIILVCIGIAILAVLPILSVNVANEWGSEQFIVRSCNLIEFSPWGVLPLMAPLLVPCILFGRQSQTVKEAEVLILLTAGMISYVHCFSLAADFLREIGASMLTRYPGAVLYPVSLVGMFLFTQMSDMTEKNE